MSDKDSSRTKPLEALSRVKEAEVEADRIVRAAREQESVQILEDLQAEIQKLRETRLADARARADRHAQERVRKAEEEAREISKTAEAEAEELRRSAEPQIRDAVARTVTKIAEIIQNRPL